MLTVGFSSNDGKESAKVCDFIYMTAVKPLYEYDSSIAYFVDCGDQDTSTLTGRDKLGSFNSVTEQLYGADPVTGAVWGLIDDPTDQYNGSSKGGGIYTANTWCDEYNAGDGRDKTASFRYTKNQYENNIARHLVYGFTLPKGRYEVEMCFSNPWSCSTKPKVTLDPGTSSEKVVMENCATDGKTPSTGEITVDGGSIRLAITSDN